MWFFKKNNEYARAIEATKGMVQDGKIQKRAKKLGLDVLDITWEDTARYEGSCVGPNISDMTIQVQHQIQNDKVAKRGSAICTTR